MSDVMSLAMAVASSIVQVQASIPVVQLLPAAAAAIAMTNLNTHDTKIYQSIDQSTIVLNNCVNAAYIRYLSSPSSQAVL